MQNIPKDDAEGVEFIGTARIMDGSLVFPKKQIVSQHRPLTCVPALIDYEILNKALLNSGTELTDLGVVRYPTLNFPPGYRLQCLCGGTGEKSRTIDLYVKDNDPGLKLPLVDKYLKGKSFTDGEIYYKWRTLQDMGLNRLSLYWVSHLKTYKQDNLNALLRHRRLADLFDSLLTIPGMWGGSFKLTTLDTIIPTEKLLPDQISNYFATIKTSFCGQFAEPEFMDEKIVMAVGRMAPGVSTLDARKITTLLPEGLLRKIRNSRGRMQWKGGMIFTLGSFFKDMPWLQDIANRMKWLVAIHPDETLCAALNRCYTGCNQEDDEAIIQTSETTFAVIHGTSEDRIELGIRHFVLFIARHRERLPIHSSKTSLSDSNKGMLRKFGELAIRIGFESPEIDKLLTYPSGEVLNGHDNNKPQLGTDGPGGEQGGRHGHMERKKVETAALLFLQNLHNLSEKIGEGVTPFFVIKERYLAFFGQIGNKDTVDRLNSLRSRMERDVRINNGVRLAEDQQKHMAKVTPRDKKQRTPHKPLNLRAQGKLQQYPNKVTGSFSREVEPRQTDAVAKRAALRKAEENQKKEKEDYEAKIKHVARLARGERLQRRTAEKQREEHKDNKQDAQIGAKTTDVTTVAKATNKSAWISAEEKTGVSTSIAETNLSTAILVACISATVAVTIMEGVLKQNATTVATQSTQTVVQKDRRHRTDEEAAGITAKKDAKKAEEEEAARVAAKEEAARVAAKEEAARVAAKEEAARVAAKKAEEEEAARVAAKEEAARVAAKKAEEEEAAPKEEAARVAAKKAEEEEAARVAAKGEATRVAANESKTTNVGDQATREIRRLQHDGKPMQLRTPAQETVGNDMAILQEVIKKRKEIPTGDENQSGKRIRVEGPRVNSSRNVAAEAAECKLPQHGVAGADNGRNKKMQDAVTLQLLKDLGDGADGPSDDRKMAQAVNLKLLTTRENLYGRSGENQIEGVQLSATIPETGETRTIEVEPSGAGERDDAMIVAVNNNSDTRPAVIAAEQEPKESRKIRLVGLASRNKRRAQATTGPKAIRQLRPLRPAAKGNKEVGKTQRREVISHTDIAQMAQELSCVVENNDDADARLGSRLTGSEVMLGVTVGCGEAQEEPRSLDIRADRVANVDVSRQLQNELKYDAQKQILLRKERAARIAAKDSTRAAVNEIEPKKRRVLHRTEKLIRRTLDDGRPIHVMKSRSQRSVDDPSSSENKYNHTMLGSRQTFRGLDLEAKTDKRAVGSDVVRKKRKGIPIGREKANQSGKRMRIDGPGVNLQHPLAGADSWDDTSDDQEAVNLQILKGSKGDSDEWRYNSYMWDEIKDAKINFHFKKYNDRDRTWEDDGTYKIEEVDSVSTLVKTAADKIGTGMELYNTEGHELEPKRCFWGSIDTKSNVILLISKEITNNKGFPRRLRRSVVPLRQRAKMELRQAGLTWMQ
ncbi:hypothetical protein VE03_10438 [Pseudogymnoascus sp. 23342-1-I1]|nr:hypothetical protein VE03_10438 [Pseudogymnoascus sp. 23342-1-I1]